ncbi:MAG TPA: aminoglycoside phosphotransferase [Prevotella sp.]|nr:aminoglycoside phosphotransferase [Prevotella sp.]
MKTTLRINPKYEALRAFVERIPSLFDHEGREIYRDRNVIKVMTAPDGTALNVKRYCVPKGPNRLVYSLGIRKPKGLRAFLYPQRLLPVGIDTPEPVAYIEERHTGLLGLSFFVSLQCDYEHTLKDVGNAEEGSYEALAKALGQFTASMHDRHVMHRDYSPGNVLYHVDTEGHYHFSLVDINRMHFGPVGERQGCLNFIRLWGPKRFFELLVRAYAEARGLDADACVAFALEKRRRFWIRYGKKHRILFKLEL